MKHIASALLVAVLASLASSAGADPWKKEGGHGHKYKETYRDGDCEVKRKVNKHGDVKEERKCAAPRPERYEEREMIVEERVVYPVREAPPPPPREPGVSINIQLGR